MLFTDQHVIVLDAFGDETGHMGIWSDELDAIARARHGYAVVINSEPEQIVADYRPQLAVKITVDSAQFVREMLFAIAWASADDCDTCWYLVTDTALDELGDDVIVAKLRAHVASGHLTTSEDEPSAP